MHAGKIRNVSATTTFLCVYSIAVAAVEKGHAFSFFGRGAAAANHFLVGCAAAAGGACAAYNISTVAEVPATVPSFYVSVIYTAMPRTSVAAVVLGCFYFCPLDCDASIMVVDCAAIETRCMLEKYIKYFSPSPLLLLSFASIPLLLLLLRGDVHFLFWMEVLLLLIFFLIGCAAAGACAA